MGKRVGGAELRGTHADGVEGGPPLAAVLLHGLTRLQFPETEAWRHLRRVDAHREGLCRLLGRDLGLAVAVLDYFVNVEHRLVNPVAVERAQLEAIERSANTDDRTGLSNHAAFLSALRREVQRARRHGCVLTVALLDVDGFKRVNDTRGHLEGDRVIVEVSTLIRDALRETDVGARYGGDEFALLLPHTASGGGYVVAERIRRDVDERFRGDARVTLSCGLASFPDAGERPELLLRAADTALYLAKAEGRNRVAVAAPHEP